MQRLHSFLGFRVVSMNKTFIDAPVPLWLLLFYFFSLIYCQQAKRAVEKQKEERTEEL